MYALPNKTQHKLIAKVRGGISQKLDNFSSPSSSSSNSNHNSSSATSSSTTPINSSSSSNSSPFRASTATLLSKESFSNNRNHIDDSGFNADCLPQPVFQHSSNQHGSKQNKFSLNKAHKQQCITPEHNEMIKYVQQSWKGVERDYKKSVNNYISNIDLNGSPTLSSSSAAVATATASVDHHLKHQQQKQGKKKTATTSTPLLLTGSYHHTSVVGKDSTGSNRQDSFRPFDLETFWGNRILKRLTQDTL